MTVPRFLQVLPNCLLALALLAGNVFAQDKYAVLIGVETYDPSVLGPLEFAEDDAIELGQSFQQLGFKTKVMTGQSRVSTGKPNSPEKILRVLTTQMNNCAEGDTIVVSLSGHGLQCGADKPDKDGVRETYFCPEDADPENKKTLLPISDVVELLRQCKASHKLLLIDACRNEFAATTGQKKTARKLQLTSVHETRKSVPGGITVLYSCNQKQFSFEDENLGHSVFSYFVIKYLKGNADSKYYVDDKISLDDLILYVRKKTNEHVADNNMSVDGQSPVYSGVGADWELGIGVSPIKAILTRHLNWLGGLEKIKKIRTVKTENIFDVTLSDGSAFPIRQMMYFKDDKVLTQNFIQGVLSESSVATLEKAWDVVDGVISRKTEKERDFTWINTHPYAVLALLDRCDEIVLLGKQSKNGRQTDVLLFGDESADFSKWYVAEDGSLAAVKWSVDDVAVEVSQSDFKVFQGFRVPTSFEGTMSNPTVGKMKVRVRKNYFDINADVSDDLFAIPGDSNQTPIASNNIDRIVADYRMFTQEYAAEFGNLVNNIDVKQLNRQAIAMDFHVPANVEQAFRQDLNSAQQMLVPIEQQMVVDMDNSVKAAVRNGLKIHVRFVSPAKAVITQFVVSASDL